MAVAEPDHAPGRSGLAPESERLETRVRTLWDSGEWARCWELLADAARADLLPDTLLALQVQLALLLGRESEHLQLSAAAYRRFLDAGAYRDAARIAFWTAFTLFNRDDAAQGAAWRARSADLVAQHDLGGAEAAALVGMDAHFAMLRHHTETARELNERALAQARADGDRDVIALGQLTRGRIGLQLGRRDEAMACLDEAMASASAGETSPLVTGTVYCAVIGVCMQLRDLHRAAEWTEALTAWGMARPDMVPFRGTCLVHRSHLDMLRGDWAAAVNQAEQAISMMRDRDVGEAYYQRGEVHRLAGDFDLAEQDYRQANSCGYQPEPGLARLRVAQGRPTVAATTLRRLLTERRRDEDRAELLAALVTALLAADDVPAARTAVTELTAITEHLDAPMLSALSTHSSGAVLLAEGAVADAVVPLRRAWQLARDLDLPHLAAQTRVLVARCLLELGDEGAAQMELDAAREALTRLGAAPDLAALDAVEHAQAALPDGLTRREAEVLRLVAEGLTNRELASRLFLSEKTVARHLSNIYAKLGIGSRAGAPAYAYTHGLLAGRE
jgi:ATP/maltotriose-dependent transcriptional regulator MalT